MTKTHQENSTPQSETLDDPRLQAAYDESVALIYRRAAEGERDLTRLILTPVAEAIWVNLSEERPESGDTTINHALFANSAEAILNHLKAEGELDTADKIWQGEARQVKTSEGAKPFEFPVVCYQDSAGSNYVMDVMHHYQGPIEGINIAAKNMEYVTGEQTTEE